MTVCIAAVCNVRKDERPVIITASDRMITIGEIEFEPQQTKTVDLASQTVALFAGDMQLHAGIISKVRERIRNTVHENITITVAEIAEIYAEEFAFYRRAKAEREILMPRGLNFDRFLARQATMAHYQVKEIDDRLTAYYIDSTALIAGVDPTGPHIFKIVNPGVVECMDTPYFAAAGSGEWLATTQFMLAKFDKTWAFPKALWLTYAAKTRAQIAGGVGERTDLVIVGAPGIIYTVTEAQKERLYEIFLRTIAKEDSARKEAEEEVEAYVKTLVAEEAKKTQPTDQGQTATTSGEPASSAQIQAPVTVAGKEPAPEDTGKSQTCEVPAPPVE